MMKLMRRTYAAVNCVTLIGAGEDGSSSYLFPHKGTSGCSHQDRLGVGGGQVIADYGGSVAKCPDRSGHGFWMNPARGDQLKDSCDCRADLLRATDKVTLRPNISALGIVERACRLPAQLQKPSRLVDRRASARPPGCALQSRTSGAVKPRSLFGGYASRPSRAACRRSQGRASKINGVGVRDCELFGERSAPGATSDTEAVHGNGWNGAAIAGKALPAGSAFAAADLKGDDDPVTGDNPRNALTHREHLGDALVTQMERERKWGTSQCERSVEITGRHGDRRYDGPSRA
jgi:hypothetical protein